MLDIGWSEMLVIAVVAILVVGPRELPGMLRNIGRFVSQMRKMAGEFQSQFTEALKDAELDDVKKDLNDIRNMASKATIGGVAAGTIPLGAAADQPKSDLKKAEAGEKDSGAESAIPPNPAGPVVVDTADGDADAIPGTDPGAEPRVQKVAS